MSNAVYQLITDTIIAKLQNGMVPWHQPWTPTSFPRNANGRPYRGINVFILMAQGYSSPYWMTYKQVQEKRGIIKKGSKSTPIVFWKWLEFEKETKDGENETKKIPMIQYYRVFNAEQTEGIEFPEIKGSDLQFNPIETAEGVIESMPNCPSIKHGGDYAAYSPLLDNIKMPHKKSFKSVEHYYCTLFHELGHSTGHLSRLNRPLTYDRKDKGYAKEELIAEMTAAFLCGHCGIGEEIFTHNASYIAEWLKELENDPKLVVIAAAKAQKAADYIIGNENENGNEE